MTATLSGLTLEDHWVRMTKRLRAPKKSLPIFKKVVKRYEHPSRVYHGVTHLTDVLEASELLCEELHVEPESRGAVALAAFYHDSMLDPRRTDNEAQSVECMIGDLAGVRMHPLALSAATLGILGTIAGHEPQGQMAKIVSDADLLVLATPWETYARYALGIRTEYARFYSEDVYIAGRIEVLEGLCDSKLLYFAAGEENAKRNMRTEIKLLKGVLPNEDA